MSKHNFGKRNIFTRAICLSIGLIFLMNTNKLVAQEGFIGEIRMFAGNFAPRGWAFCDGREINILDNTALFSILGTQYGGDGQKTFALPDLRARFPMGAGKSNDGTQTYPGEKGGNRTVSITTQNLPPHQHPIRVSTEVGNTDDPQGNTLSIGVTPDLYKLKSFTTSQPNVPLNINTEQPVGSGQPVNVMPPYTTINFIICVEGDFPSRN